MSNCKYIAIIVGLVIAMFALQKSTNIKEGFGMIPSRTWKVDRVVAPDAQAAMSGNFYSVPGTYQAMLNPRFSNTDYGAQIRYSLPSTDKMATPCHPLTYGNMIKENYTKENYGCSSCGGGCRPSSCVAKPAGHHLAPTKTEYEKALENAQSGGNQYPEVASALPVGDMTMMSTGEDGHQPIVYDRYIYANRASRLRSQGDPIRGDLPIVPCASDWFRPSVHPTIDLHQGAMNVIGGNQNETASAMANLMFSASGGGDTTIGGVDMTTHFAAVNDGARGIQLSAYQ
jgi:hypothetical protein